MVCQMAKLKVLSVELMWLNAKQIDYYRSAKFYQKSELF
jgi:hypothetical protein